MPRIAPSFRLTLESIALGQVVAQPGEVQPWWRSKKLWAAFSLAAVLYAGSYLYLRGNRVIVHTAGFATGAEGRVIAGHGMRTGDPGIPLLNPRHGFGMLFVGLVFFPLADIEAVLWYTIKPTGTPWPYGESLLDQSGQDPTSEASD